MKGYLVIIACILIVVSIKYDPVTPCDTASRCLHQAEEYARQGQHEEALEALEEAVERERDR